LKKETKTPRQYDGKNATTAPTITRRIGQTTYRVKVHFNPNSKETVNDKIIRMIKNETAVRAAGE
jgi:hypothetical protein